MKNTKEHNKEGWKPLDEVKEYVTSLEGNWKQRGPYLINESGQITYSVYVGTNIRLVGVENGKPKLEKVN